MARGLTLASGFFWSAAPSPFDVFDADQQQAVRGFARHLESLTLIHRKAVLVKELGRFEADGASSFRQRKRSFFFVPVGDFYAYDLSSLVKKQDCVFDRIEAECSHRCSVKRDQATRSNGRSRSCSCSLWRYKPLKGHRPPPKGSFLIYSISFLKSRKFVQEFSRTSGGKWSQVVKSNAPFVGNRSSIGHRYLRRSLVISKDTIVEESSF